MYYCTITTLITMIQFNCTYNHSVFLLSKEPVIYSIFVLVSGIFIALLPVFNTPVSLAVCSGLVGLFYASVGPIGAEVCCIITTPELYSFGYGFLTICSGLGWVLGAPVAGKYN